MSAKKDIYWRAYLIYFGFAIALLVVLIKTISIQFEGGKPYFINTSGGNIKIPTRTVEREPRRGQEEQREPKRVSKDLQMKSSDSMEQASAQSTQPRFFHRVSYMLLWLLICPSKLY